MMIEKGVASGKGWAALKGRGEMKIRKVREIRFCHEIFIIIAFTHLLKTLDLIRYTNIVLGLYIVKIIQMH